MTISDGAWERIYANGRAEMDRLPTLEVAPDYHVSSPHPDHRNIHLSPGWAGDVVSLWDLPRWRRTFTTNLPPVFDGHARSFRNQPRRLYASIRATVSKL